MEPPSRVPSLLSLVAFGVPLLVYGVTLCPDVFVGDSGEMVTIACQLGVPQPTGFPLYCLLGKLCCAWPFLTVAARVNVLSALATGVTCLALYGLLSRFTKPAVAVSAALLYGLAHTPWSQATIARTYPLTQALIAMEVFLAAQVCGKPGDRRVLGLALLCGFSLSTHLLSILFLPMLAYVASFENWSRRLAGTVLFVLGLSLYAYIPLRAGVTTYNVYGPVRNAAEFWSYVREEHYKDKQFSRSASNLRAFAQTLLHQATTEHMVAPVMLPLVLLGVFQLARKSAPVAGYLLLGSCLNVFILMSYGDDKDIPFLPRYFLFVCFAASVFWGAGLDAILAAVPRRFPRLLLGGGVAAYLVASGMENFRICDRSRTHFPSLYARALLEPLPARSVLFLAGDAPLLMCDYLQQCLGIRTDVQIVDRDHWSELATAFRAGKVPTRPTFANFLPAVFPRGHRAVHSGLTWEITARAGLVNRALVWQSLPRDRVVFDPSLSDFEAAALAGEIFFHRGVDALEEHQDMQARDAFETARKVSPTNRRLCYSLARVCATRGWVADARMFVEAGLALEVERPSPEFKAKAYQAVGLPAPASGGS
jgi:hypothetical protein